MIALEETLEIFDEEEETVLLEMLMRLEQQLWDMAKRREKTVKKDRSA